MSQRVIETVLQLSGEGAYAAALRTCGNEMKVLKSELASVSSEYRNNANSVDALTAKSSVLAQMYATQAAKVETLKAAVAESTAARAQEQATLDDLRAKYEAAKQAMDAAKKAQGENSQAYLEAKGNVDALRDAIIQHQARLTSAENATTRYTVQLNRAQVELNGLADQQAQTNQLLEEAKNSADGCAKSIDQYGNAVGKAAGGTADAQQAVEALAVSMVASGAKEGAEELTHALLECEAAAGVFETGVAKISTIADQSVMSNQQWAEGLLDLSNALGQQAGQLAEASYEALSSGIKTAETLDFVRQATQLAVAGFTDSAKAVDVLTTILNAYGLEASQTESVASKLVKTQDLGKITVDQLGECMGRVIPSAAAYGVSLDNIATSYALMTANGVNARNSTTYLTRMLDEMASSSSKVSAILQEQTGKSFTELMAEGRSLGDVLDIISNGVNGSKAAFQELWGQATAGRAALSLLGSGSDEFNATMEEMANSSGTVAKNFEKMANTSEYAQQRVSVAAQNMQIAVGSQLNPILNELRNSGAGIMESAAEVVSQSPALVAAIVGITTALGALAGALAVVAAVKALNAALEALNVTMLKSPWTLVAAGIAGLVAAFATLEAKAKAAQAEVEELSSAAQSLNEAVSGNEKAFSETNTAIDAAAATVDRYIDRLEELEAAGVKTTAQQNEYALLLERIRDIMPEIDLDLGNNGQIEGGADAIRDQAAAWEELARAKAIATRMDSYNSAIADAQFEQTVNTLKLADAQAKGADIATQLAIKQNQLNAAIELYGPASEASVNSMGVLDAETARGVGIVESFRQEVFDLQQQQKANQQEQDNLTQAIENGSTALENAQENYEYAKKACDALGKSTDDAANTVEDGNQRIAESAAEMSEEQQRAYQAAAEAAVENINKQYGLFDKLSTKSKYSVSQMIDNLESQAKGFETYTDNLGKALERGVDEGLVKALSDGSVESMGYLAAIVSASDEQIAELNAIYGERNQAGAEMSGAMAEVVTAVESASGPMAAAGYAAGAAAINAIIAAINAGAPRVAGALAAAAGGGGGGSGAGGGDGGGGSGGSGGRSASRSASARTITYSAGNSQPMSAPAPQPAPPTTPAAMGQGGEIKPVAIVQQSVPNVPDPVVPIAPHPSPAVALTVNITAAEVVYRAAAEELRASRIPASIAARRADIPDPKMISRAAKPARQEPILPVLGKILTALQHGATIVLEDGTVVGRIDNAMGRRNALAERGAI